MPYYTQRTPESPRRRMNALFL